MLRSKKSFAYRVNNSSPSNLPLTVRSAGSFTLYPGSRIETPQIKWFSEIFWSEKGCGEFVLEKQRFQVRNCEVFYLLPGEIHDIRPLTSPWVYHWFTLDHEMSPDWLKAFGFDRRPIPAKACPAGLFNNLRNAVRAGTLQGNCQASHLAHAILLAFVQAGAGGSLAHNSLAEKCKAAIDEDFTDPRMNVDELARSLKIHRTTLFRAFVGAFGMQPSEYLQGRRLRRALHLLKQSDLPIKEIALRVGIPDPNYLTRMIRRTFGMSAQKFRSQNRLDTERPV